MDAKRWTVIDSLYHAALAKEPGERSSYLAAACADDPTLQSEIESLLAYADAELSSPAQPPKMAKLLDELSETATLVREGLVGTAATRTAPRTSGRNRPLSDSAAPGRRRHGRRL